MLTSSSTSEILTHKSRKISTSTSQYPKTHKKFFSKRLVTRDQLSDMANNNNLSSLEDYYYNGSGSSVSVPFMWESHPGTPKVKFREKPNLPPLTPPPSYCYSPASVTKTSSPPPNNSRKTNLLWTIFPKHYGARRRRSPTSPSLSSSLSSNSPRSTLYTSLVTSSPVVSKTPSLKSRNIISSPRVSVDSRVDDGHDHEHEDEYSSPVSTLCFGRGGVNPSSRSGCYFSLIKVLLS